MPKETTFNKRTKLDIGYWKGEPVVCLGVPPRIGATVRFDKHASYIVRQLRYDPCSDTTVVYLEPGTPLNSDVHTIQDGKFIQVPCEST